MIKATITYETPIIGTMVPVILTILLPPPRRQYPVTIAIIAPIIRGVVEAL